MLDITEKNGLALLRVRVQPKSSVNAARGERAGALLLKVTAPPDKGKANRAARELLAALLRVAKSDVELVRGAASRDKLFALRGLTKAGLAKRLEGKLN